MKLVRTVAVLLVSAGLSTVGYVGYLHITAPVEGAVAVDEPLDSPMFTDPSTAPSATAKTEKAKIRIIEQPKLGAEFATLEIPRMNKSWKIKQGVRKDDIRRNPGHYPGTAMPGEVGNFALAGHRIRSMFWDVDRLQSGDRILVKFKGTTYTYRVYKRYTVKPTAVDVIFPTPGSEAPPVRKILTLTTCLKSGNHLREVVHATQQE